MYDGRVVQVIGTVVDVHFPGTVPPPIGQALELQSGDRLLVLEVRQHIGNNRVRTIALAPTRRGEQGQHVRDCRRHLSSGGQEHARPALQRTWRAD